MCSEAAVFTKTLWESSENAKMQNGQMWTSIVWGKFRSLEININKWLFAIYDPKTKKILFDLVTRWQRSDIGRFGFSQVFASLHRQCPVPLRASASGRGHSSSLLLNLMYLSFDFQQIKISNSSWKQLLDNSGVASIVLIFLGFLKRSTTAQ